jgi:murein L,D-transpeptidase YcbB/YkuD
VRLQVEAGARPVLADLHAFDAARDGRPVWFSSAHGPALPAARQLLRALCEAGDVGPSPAAVEAGALGEALARAERGEEDRRAVDLQLSRAFLLHAAHRAHGGLAPGRFGWPTRPEPADLGAALEQALATGDVASALAGLDPAHPGFLRLRRALADYTSLAEVGGWPQLPAAGRTLRQGVREARVRLLRQRLMAEGDLRQEVSFAAADLDLFDAEVAAAVRRYQERHALAPDGAVGAGTLASLNIPASARVEQLRVNLARWRWLPAALGERHLAVNLAAAELEAVERGEVRHRMRVVVGEPDWRTPLLADRVTHLVVNPRWAVPARILREEVLPKLRQSPSAAARLGLEVYAEDGRRVDPATVDWAALGDGPIPYRLRQAAGPTNPLGELKFVMTNRSGILLHDTPARAAFAQPRRARSHGCVRVEQPEVLARFALAPSVGAELGAAELAGALEGGATREVPLPAPLPVHLLYWTASVAEDGRVHFHPDVYGQDAALAGALRARDGASAACPGAEGAQGVGGAGPSLAP